MVQPIFPGGRFVMVILCFATLFATSPGIGQVAQPATVPATDAVSIEDAKRVAKEIESGIAAGNAAVFNERFDTAGFAEKVVGNVATTPQVKSGFLAGFIDSKTGVQLGQQIVQGMGDTGHYRLIRVESEEGRPVALFRLGTSDGVSYHKLYFISRGGQTLVEDFYVALTGEQISQTLRRLYLPMALQSSAPDTPESKATLRGYQQLEKLTHLKNQGKFEEYLAGFDQLPDSLQRDTSVVLQRVIVARQVSNEEMMAAIAHARPHMQDSIAIDLISIDALTHAKQFDAAREAIGRIEKWTKGDIFAEVLRASVSYSEGKPGDAKRHAKSALKVDPSLYQAHDILFIVSRDEKDHAETARLLGVFEKDFGMRFDNLKTVEGFEDFVASPEYAQWMKQRAAR